MNHVCHCIFVYRLPERRLTLFNSLIAFDAEFHIYFKSINSIYCCLSQRRAAILTSFFNDLLRYNFLMDNKLRIRLETSGDEKAVERMTREAFWGLYNPGAVEHYVAHLLRASDGFNKKLDLVLFKGEELIGSVMGSAAVIGGKKDASLVFIGPLCIKKSEEGKGYGSILLREFIARAKHLRLTAILLYGNPVFYGRFGFRKASDFSFLTPKGKELDEFMVLPLNIEKLRKYSGPIGYDEGFVPDAAFGEYDEGFSLSPIDAYRKEMYGKDFDLSSLRESAMVGSPLKTCHLSSPKIKAIAERFSGDKALELSAFPLHESVEMTLSYFIIGLIRAKTFKAQMAFLEKNLKDAQTWIVTDSAPQYIASAPLEEYVPFFLEFIASPHEYEKRFAYVFAMRYYRKEDISVLINNLRYDDFYYIYMAQAWMLATLAITHFDEVYGFLRRKEVPLTLRRKTISKMVDSYRISSSQKAIVKRLRASFTK
jgi:predicted N-acetyltransferase YhbS/3-methyladenine DNA glycosylase AlkD